MSNLVDFNPHRGSVVLRGIEIGLADIGRGFVVAEGLLPEDQIKAKYKLTDSSWARLAENGPLVQAVRRYWFCPTCPDLSDLTSSY